MQNIPSLEQVFSKGKDKNIAGEFCEFWDHSRLLFIALHFQGIKLIHIS